MRTHQASWQNIYTSFNALIYLLLVKEREKLKKCYLESNSYNKHLSSCFYVFIYNVLCFYHNYKYIYIINILVVDGGKSTLMTRKNIICIFSLSQNCYIPGFLTVRYTHLAVLPLSVTHLAKDSSYNLGS